MEGGITWPTALGGLAAFLLGLKYIWPSLKSFSEAAVGRNKVDTETYSLTRDVLQEQRALIAELTAARLEIAKLTAELSQAREELEGARRRLLETESRCETSQRN